MAGCLLFIVVAVGWLIIKSLIGAGADYASYKYEEHKINKANDENETTFIKYLAVMSAKIANADGNVSDIEIRSFFEVFNKLGLSESKISICKEYFQKGLNTSISIYSTADEFYRKFPQNEICSILYSVLAYVALADELINAEELKILRNLPTHLHISQDFFLSFCNSAGIDPNANKDQKVGSYNEESAFDPYEVLGASKEASDEELKKIYREKIKKYHPDVLRGQGVPEEMLKFANDEMAKLNSAWEQIQKERKNNPKHYDCNKSDGSTYKSAFSEKNSHESNFNNNLNKNRQSTSDNSKASSNFDHNNLNQEKRSKSESSNFDHNKVYQDIDANFKRNLIDTYTSVYENTQNLDPAEAKRVATELFDSAAKEALEKGLFDLPKNLGNMIIDKIVPFHPKAKEIYDKTRKRMLRLKNELVKNKDVIWWWNLTEIERIMINKNDETVRFAFFLDKLQAIADQYPSVEAATPAAKVMVNKAFAIYGYEESPTFCQDSPLPFELKDRVDAYMEKIALNGEIYNLKNKTQQYSSFNAFVRSEIKAGNL